MALVLQPTTTQVSCKWCGFMAGARGFHAEQDSSKLYSSKLYPEPALGEVHDKELHHSTLKLLNLSPYA